MSKCLLFVVLVITLSGCGGTVTLPVQDADGREVALLQHARHSSLVLTRADHTRVRYAYGDWAWYVEQETGPISGVRALFLPSRSALGRAELPAAREGESLEAVVGVGIDRVHVFHVAAEHIDALLDRLDRAFTSTGQPAVFNAARELSFVADERPYHLLHSSNPVVAGWLDELGVEVRGSPLFGIWRIANSAQGTRIAFSPTAEPRGD